MIILVSAVGGKAFGQANLLKQAETEFTRQQYDDAIASYKKYLRRFPKDYDAWNFLAASYYHTGLPDKALQALKRVESVTKLQSYNSYYQGLAYAIMRQPAKAKAQLLKAAQYRDEWGGQAIFELAVMEYRSQDATSALHWVTVYQTQYPQGPAAERVARLRDLLQRGEYDPNFIGTPRPDMEESLFRYSEYSLLPYPHYWFWQMGYRYEQGLVNNPARDNQTGLPTVKTEGFAEHDLLMNAGFGLGPFEDKNALSYIGYHYYQEWNADNDRMSTFLNDPSNLEFIPFRPDLLQRFHEIYGYFKKNTNQFFHLGVLGSYEWGRVGSSLIPSTGEAGLQRSLNLSQTSLLMPWMGIEYGDNYETIFYLYLRKELNDEAPEYSNKTYNFLYDSSEKALSFGLSQRVRIPRYRTDLSAEVFRYQYIYNDYWMDFTRTGFILTGDVSVTGNLDVHGGFSSYTDIYTLEQIRTGSCSFNPSTGSRDIKVCPRIDRARIMQLGLSWNFSQFQSVSGYYNHMINQNAEMKVFEKTRDQLLVQFQFAFPAVKRVAPLARRFGEDDILKKVY